MKYQIHWKIYHPTAGSYVGAETIEAQDQFNACLQLGKRGLHPDAKITKIEEIMSNKSPKELYEDHLKAWETVGYKPSKEDLEELRILYKIKKEDTKD